MFACSSLPRIDAASADDALSTRHTHSSRAAVLAKEAMVECEEKGGVQRCCRIHKLCIKSCSAGAVSDDSSAKVARRQARSVMCRVSHYLIRYLCFGHAADDNYRLNIK